MPHKILITGALGQLGKAIIEELDPSFTLIPTDKNDNGPYQNYSKFDISKIDNIKSIVKKFDPDIIINLAAMTDVDGCELNPSIARTINAVSINNLLELYKGKFIQLSTDYVFDGEDGPYGEDDPVNPINIYGKTKLEAERYVENNSSNWCILRTNVLFDYGEDSDASFMKWVIDSLSSNKKIRVVNDQWNNPIWTNNMAKVIEQVIINDVQGRYHCGGADYVNRYDFAKMIASEFGLNSDLINSIDSKSLNQSAKRPLKGGLNTDKIEEALNIKFNKLHDCLIDIKKRLNK